MSANYETSKKNYQQLNEDMVKLKRKFKYVGLKTSLGLPQDDQERMQRVLNMWKHQVGEAQKKVTQLESADRANDARHFEEMEKMKAIIRNERGKRLVVTDERDLLQNMVQTLEHQLQ